MRQVMKSLGHGPLIQALKLPNERFKSTGYSQIDYFQGDTADCKTGCDDRAANNEEEDLDPRVAVLADKQVQPSVPSRSSQGEQCYHDNQNVDERYQHQARFTHHEFAHISLVNDISGTIHEEGTQLKTNVPLSIRCSPNTGSVSAHDRSRHQKLYPHHLRLHDPVSKPQQHQHRIDGWQRIRSSSGNRPSKYVGRVRARRLPALHYYERNGGSHRSLKLNTLALQTVDSHGPFYGRSEHLPTALWQEKDLSRIGEMCPRGWQASISNQLSSLQRDTRIHRTAHLRVRGRKTLQSSSSKRGARLGSIAPPVYRHNTQIIPVSRNESKSIDPDLKTFTNSTIQVAFLAGNRQSTPESTQCMNAQIMTIQNPPKDLVFPQLKCYAASNRHSIVRPSSPSCTGAQRTNPTMSINSGDPMNISGGDLTNMSNGASMCISTSLPVKARFPITNDLQGEIIGFVDAIDSFTSLTCLLNILQQFADRFKTDVSIKRPKKANTISLLGSDTSLSLTPYLSPPLPLRQKGPSSAVKGEEQGALGVDNELVEHPLRSFLQIVRAMMALIQRMHEINEAGTTILWIIAPESMSLATRPTACSLQTIWTQDDTATSLPNSHVSRITLSITPQYSSLDIHFDLVIGIIREMQVSKEASTTNFRMSDPEPVLKTKLDQWLDQHSRDISAGLSKRC